MSQYPSAISDHSKPRPIRERDAGDITEEMLRGARKLRATMSLWLLPDGEFRITPINTTENDSMMATSERSLVGVYDGFATRADVMDDVWARAAAIGMEWPR